MRDTPVVIGVAPALEFSRDCLTSGSLYADASRPKNGVDDDSCAGNEPRGALSARTLLHRGLLIFAMSAGFAPIVEPRVALAGESSVAPGPATSQPPASKPIAPTTQSKNAAPKPATLFVGPLDTKRAGESVALSVSARDLTGGFVVISGFAPGTSLSVGTLLGDSSWWVPTAELEHLEIRPPSRFVGSMDITVELRRADTKLADRKSLHIEWVPVVSLDADQMSALLARANELIASGDIAAAQLVLRRAAEAGSAQAAMTLAGTYDPVLLAKLGVHGFEADIVAARQWYEKAKQLGSIEAERRLELLAVKRD